MLRGAKLCLTRSVRGIAVLKHTPAPFVQLEVGGVPFSVSVGDIAKHPESIFSKLDVNASVHQIDRDGSLFRYVGAFLVTGHLPRNETGQITLDLTTVEALKKESHFFGLPALQRECESFSTAADAYLDGYKTIRKYILNELETIDASTDCWRDIEYCSDLINKLKQMWAPVSVIGQIDLLEWDLHKKLIGSSTLSDLQTERLIRNYCRNRNPARKTFKIHN